MIQYLIRILLSLCPVLVFLLALVYLDSFKLVRIRAVLFAILLGAAAAVLSFLANIWLIETISWNLATYRKYVAPVIEEILKSVYLVYLMKSHRVGFVVDAAIYGFALGAGFALAENVYYLESLHTAGLFVWLVRGFGTAIMHGSTTAIFGILSKSLSDRYPTQGIAVYVPGLAIAIAIHSLFNHFVLSPLISTLLLLLFLPMLMVLIFEQSERATRKWLGVGFDTDQELLEMITSGDLSETKVGRYLDSLKSNFAGEIVADMLCFLRLHLEVAIRAKGILLMREAGFRPTTDPDMAAKFDEMNYLERSIGKTGLLAIAPFIHTSTRDLWQLHMVGKS